MGELSPDEREAMTHLHQESDPGAQSWISSPLTASTARVRAGPDPGLDLGEERG
jgi:hypothetical protein